MIFRLGTTGRKIQASDALLYSALIMPILISLCAAPPSSEDPSDDIGQGSIGDTDQTSRQTRCLRSSLYHAMLVRFRLYQVSARIELDDLGWQRPIMMSVYGPFP